MSILEQILAAKRGEIEDLRRRVLPFAPPPVPCDLRRAPGGPLRVIAEIKRRSPSAGALSTRLSVGERARAYQRAGASAISVLCDPTFFDGRFEHLLEARSFCSLPLLCKDFILDEVQLDAARAFGASLVLLIVRCLPASRVVELVGGARDRGLEPLVEVTTEEEAVIAVDAGARWVGVNARDLDTLAMDSGRTERVLRGLPDSVTRIHLSGLARPEDVAKVARSPADAALIGEALMRQDDPELLLGQLVQAGRGE